MVPMLIFWWKIYNSNHMLIKLHSYTLFCISKAIKLFLVLWTQSNHNNLNIEQKILFFIWFHTIFNYICFPCHTFCILVVRTEWDHHLIKYSRFNLTTTTDRGNPLEYCLKPLSISIQRNPHQNWIKNINCNTCIS